jgi:hypothetical protein
MKKRSPMIFVGRERYSMVFSPRRIISAYGWRMERARMMYHASARAER